MKKLLLFTPILLILLFTACEKDEKPNQQPTAPTLISPEDGAVINSTEFDFTWGSSTDAEGDKIKYFLCIESDDSTVDIESTISCDYIYDLLKPGKKYRWKVYADYANQAETIIPAFISEHESASDIWCFYTSPANVSNLSDTSGNGFVTLIWTDIDNLDHVEITITPEISGLSQPILINPGIEKAEFTGLPNRTIYSFSVVAIDKEGNSSTANTIKSVPHASDEVIDADFNVYTTVKIGEQIWMRENLRTSRYQDGSEIIRDGNKLYSITDKSDIYGYYYSAFMTSKDINPDKNPCPCEFRISTDDDYKTLELYLGMSQEEIDTSGSKFFRGETERIGAALKSVSGWDEFDGNDGNGIDMYGFNLLPAGMVRIAALSEGGYEEFLYSGQYSFLHTSTGEGSTITARFFSNESDGVSRITNTGGYSFRGSIRCIKE